jgi:hypothetical protein
MDGHLIPASEALLEYGDRENPEYGVMGNQVVDLSHIFPGDSEMAHRIRDFDWSRTVFGNPDT